jgi:hypothetical protein
LRNALAKTPQRLREAFHQLATDAMTATSENAARVAFCALKIAMGNDAGRAVHCLEKDLESLLAHYKFDKPFWRSLRTTNPTGKRTPHKKKLELGYTAGGLWVIFVQDFCLFPKFESIHRPAGTYLQSDSGVFQVGGYKEAGATKICLSIQSFATNALNGTCFLC